MKLEIKNIQWLILIACFLFLAACKKIDAYKDFGGGKEILYAGKPDSAIAYSGKSRIMLSWLRASDPKVVKTRVFWNNHKDSVEVSLATASSKRISTIINLAEGNYNFELYNYDAVGNHSVVSRCSGSAYGEVFQKSLFNRNLDNFYAKQFNLPYNAALSWSNSDVKSVGVEVIYKNSQGVDKRVTSNAKAASTFLPDYDLTSPVSYRTMFLPDSSAIDTFFTEAIIKSPAALLPGQIHLKNSGYPFKAAKTVGRWGTLADWNTNDAAKNHDGPVGGLDNLNTSIDNYISFEFWGTPAINNGKISQTGTLPAGSYRLVVTISSINNNLEDSYISIAKGTELPDVANISSSLARLKLTNSQMNNKDFTLSFTLTQQEILSLGMVCTMKNVNESSLRIRKFVLFKD
ncbi:DUF4998 domain-containing protein [Pedobacter mendelii]|uniref:DUF5013 domain-containing protein n=1 Tax=Pedobacter mendelii TaxID=1908240 RepID=A0ABQ2BIX1_9SPHI|nr:DUF4998 domain-containing protein [Pedobacter mendelii]GGI25702.1 hypothetical protein GCM10008119_18990 [Pedobacter mendelii]